MGIGRRRKGASDTDERESERKRKKRTDMMMMMKNRSVSVIAVLVLAMMIAGVSAVCPPPGYDSVEPFSLEAYVADGTPWFVQQQVPISYQPENSLFCVRARYTELPNGRINVDNSARVDSIDGQQ